MTACEMSVYICTDLTTIKATFVMEETLYVGTILTVFYKVSVPEISQNHQFNN